MARRKGGRFCRRGRGPPGEHPNRPGKNPAKPKVAVRGRPPRLAHLVAGSDRNQWRARDPIPDEALVLRRAQPRAGMSNRAGGGARESRREISACPTRTGCRISCRHRTVRAADGIPEGRFRSRHHSLAARLRPVGRRLGLHDARPTARRAWHFGSRRADCRQPDACADRDPGNTGADRARDANCPLHLNALVPVPDKLLRLGPEDPAVLAWLWENWRTTRMLRDVALAPVGRAGFSHPPVMMLSATGSGPATGRPGERWPRCGPDGRPWHCTSKSSVSPSSGGLIRTFRLIAGRLVATE